MSSSGKSKSTIDLELLVDFFVSFVEVSLY